MKSIMENINLEKGFITEKEILKIKMRLNGTSGAGKQTTQFKPSDIQFPDGGFKLSPEQTQKGLTWLKDQWQTPNGKERKNNPFGYREEDAIKNFTEFRLIDFFDTASYYAVQSGIHNYIPVYEVIGKENNFQYYYNGGKVSIIG